MGFGDVVGMSSESASFSSGDQQCKKSTFMTGTINIPDRERQRRTGNAEIEITAESFCDCGTGRTSSCNNPEYGSATEVCRTVYDDLGDPVEECVNVHLTEDELLGIPTAFCVESVPYPEDMGTCPPKPPGKVTCNCEGDGKEKLNDSPLVSNLMSADGKRVTEYIGNGKPRQAMDAADCGSCDASPTG